MNVMIVAAAAMAASLPVTAASAQVTRHPGAAQSPILNGVTVGPNSTLVILSGQVPPAVDTTKPADSIEAYGDTKTQAMGTFRKIETLLGQRGLGMGDVVKLTVFLVGDPKLGGKMDFKGFSEAYAQFFGTTAQPNKAARSTVQISGLANPGFLVEIEAIAAK